MIEFFLNYSTKKKFVWIEKREEVNAPSRKEISLVCAQLYPGICKYFEGPTSRHVWATM
jgi:hypothetical protein